VSSVFVDFWGDPIEGASRGRRDLARPPRASTADTHMHVLSDGREFDYGEMLR
jgi:hypothetical protein